MKAPEIQIHDRHELLNGKKKYVNAVSPELTKVGRERPLSSFQRFQLAQLNR